MNRELKPIVEAVGTVLIDKEQVIKQSLACMLAGGHLLIEDLPGMGKTTLASALARLLGLSYSRIQFTSDMLPADITGVSIYDRENNKFEFHPGPVFSQLLLADEINRTTPKTQSALLEAMAEQQVTVDGVSHQLPDPYFVIATQNPEEQSGTFPLPESQLDRFLMRVSIGYPSEESEKQLLMGGDTRVKLKHMKPLASAEQLLAWQQQCRQVKCSDSVIAYIQRLIAFTRSDLHFAYGVSPRASLALLDCAKSWAFIEGRQYVVPEDVQAVVGSVFSHRIHGAGEFTGVPSSRLIEKMLSQVDVFE